MTKLPIVLTLREANRWTLGPGWYEDNIGDPELTPYFDVDPDAPADALLADVQAWAAEAIRKTTGLLVTGWIGYTPLLAREVHTVAIMTGVGLSGPHRVTASRAAQVLEQLWDVNFVIVIQTSASRSESIPVRSIVSVEHEVTLEEVDNC